MYTGHLEGVLIFHNLGNKYLGFVKITLGPKYVPGGGRGWGVCVELKPNTWASSDRQQEGQCFMFPGLRALIQSTTRAET